MNDEDTQAELSRYRKAFLSYVRNGMEGGVDNALADGSDPDGGYRAPLTISQQVAQVVWEASPMRRLASVETIASDVLLLDEEEPGGESRETHERPLQTDVTSPLVEKRLIPTHELYAQPKATQKLVADSAIDIENWLANKIADIFARRESQAFIHGTGVGMPNGILPYVSRGLIEVTRSGVNGEVTADGLIALYRSLSADRAKRAWFIMNQTTAPAVRLLQDPTTSAYLWQPGLAAGSPDTLMGVPVMVVNDMPHASLGALAVAVGDFQAGYQIVDQAGVRILRDPFTEKPFVKFYATKRVGADVIDTNAIKVMSLAA